ncbi:MAG: TonB-dependent receptor [Gammaproteobacteria bacterium]|nr:TonB-dependent receptor [Gammaproteobacteria bacterium]
MTGEQRRPQSLFRKKQIALAVSGISAMLVGGQPMLAYAQDSDTITVTGSRIARRDLTAPSPIMTVDTGSFENSATTGVESVLNQMPQFVPGNTQFTSSIQNSATSTPGAATLNLRGLGSNRNLILIDGRRAQPANATLAVDVNTIPSSAIANVEVITGGASAVYGPDAMAGVVNFVLKDDFEGIEFDAQYGVTEDGDGDESRISTLMGMNSADGRGNIMIGLDWTKRKPVFQRDRQFYVDAWMDPENPSGAFVQARSYFGGTNLPSQAAVDALFPQAAPGTVGVSSEFRFNEDGSVFVNQGALGYNGPYNCLDCGPFTMMKQLTDGNLDQFTTTGYLSTPLERHSVFLRGTYEINDSISGFFQGNYSNIEVTQRGGIPPAITVWQAAVPRDGRTLPDDLNTLLDSRATPGGDWALFQVLDYNGPIEPVNSNNVWQLMAGVEGELMDGDWTWEAYVSRGETSIVAENFRMPSLQRYQFLVSRPNFGAGDAWTAPDGGRGYLISCPSGLPVFSDFTPDESCLDDIDTRLINRSKLVQEIVEVNLQGGAFELPAGEVRFAVGSTYRYNSFEFQPGNPLGQLRDNPIGVFASNGTGGAIDVYEFYGEALVPVLDNLDLELGIRYSDFSTAGGKETYKALFTWAPMESLSFRGGFQYATRAPNIAELFTAPTQEVVFHPDQDPCSVTTLSPWGNVASNPDRQQVIDLCRAIIGNNTSQFDTQTYSITGIPGPEGFHRQNPPFFPLEIALRQGNPDVAPETGKTFTVGAVIADPFGVENLNITIDAYRIELSDAISPLSVATVYNNCFNWDGNSNPTYDVNNSWCQMIRRNPVTGDREEVDTPFFNLGSLTTQGIDLTINYGRDIGPGFFNVNTTINYLNKFKYQVAPGDIIVDAKGTLDQGGLFDIQAFTRFSYSWDNFSVGLNWRYLDSIKAAAAAQSPNTTIQGTGSYNLFNLNASWNIGERYSVRFGIDNLFDHDMVAVNNNPGVDSNSDNTVASIYDPLGRRFYLGFKASY